MLDYSNHHIPVLSSLFISLGGQVHLVRRAQGHGRIVHSVRPSGMQEHIKSIAMFVHGDKGAGGACGKYKGSDMEMTNTGIWYILSANEGIHDNKKELRQVRSTV